MEFKNATVIFMSCHFEEAHVANDVAGSFYPVINRTQTAGVVNELRKPGELLLATDQFQAWEKAEQIRIEHPEGQLRLFVSPGTGRIKNDQLCFMAR
ncbi:hypothetical protein [Pseudomonas sp. B392_1p]|uniref:hypothetical protein n=1 Tax=Pseudomonas sp. B392_1p TaxID=3457507 RepID=UPI003FD29618